MGYKALKKAFRNVKSTRISFTTVLFILLMPVVCVLNIAFFVVDEMYEKECLLVSCNCGNDDEHDLHWPPDEQDPIDYPTLVGASGEFNLTTYSILKGTKVKLGIIKKASLVPQLIQERAYLSALNFSTHPKIQTRFKVFVFVRNFRI